MSRRSGTGRGGRRGAARPRLALGGLAAAAAVLPCGWTWNDPGAHGVGSAVVLAVGGQLLLGRARALEPERACARALEAASALHVHLTRAKVVCVNRQDGAVLLTFTWQGARTDLLDADGVLLHSVLRNCLDTGWTMTVPVDDEDVARLLTEDRWGGQLDIYACVDLDTHREGGVAQHGVVRDGYGLEFGSWSGTLTARGAVAAIGSRPV